jgi:hypothetical protein
MFYCTIPNGKMYPSPTGYTNGKNVCTKYQASTSDPVADKCIAVGTTFGDSSHAWCVVKDTTYTDTTAFKNAMKGVLVAYEKAS